MRLWLSRSALYLLGLHFAVFTPSLYAQIRLEARLIASDGVPNALFGDAVAIDSGLALVGAWGDDSATGAAYILARSNGIWTQQARMLLADGADFDQFGYSVALQGDAAAIGAIGRNNRQGTVYIFANVNGVWQQSATLRASDGVPGDEFGAAVALDGDTLIIGAHEHDSSGIYNSGAAYVFVRNGGTWTQQAKLVASDGSPDASLGSAVALHRDTALIGAPNAAVGGNELQGAAYVYVRSGQNWIQQAKLVAPDGERADIFGVSVALDDDTALVGANQTRIANITTGSAHVFVRSADSWTHQARLIPQDGQASVSYGVAVALEGTKALIGASGGGTTGIVDLYTRESAGWTLSARLEPGDGIRHDFFGTRLAMDGGDVLVGASGDTVGNNSQQGSAFVFSGILPTVNASVSVPTTNWQGLAILTIVLLACGMHRSMSIGRS